MLLTRESFHGLCRARDLLHEIDESVLPIRDVAREAGISHFHFIRQFEAVFGVTPHQFRIQSRLDRARLLLAQGHHSVTDVCLEVGFSSLGSFSDLFARRVGMAPSAYQKKARVLVPVLGVPQELFPGCLSLMAYLPASAFAIFEKRSLPSLR